MDKKQMDVLTIQKLPHGGYIVINGYIDDPVFASLRLSDCLLYIEEMMTFDDGSKEQYLTEKCQLDDCGC